eukprot:219226-Rhodomonas_salina.1
MVERVLTPCAASRQSTGQVKKKHQHETMVSFRPVPRGCTISATALRRPTPADQMTMIRNTCGVAPAPTGAAAGGGGGQQQGRAAQVPVLYNGGAASVYGCSCAI